MVQVGKTQLRYQLRCIEDLHAMLKAEGDWVLLGSADEQKPAAEAYVEGVGPVGKNPVGGWYGLKKGLRRQFGMYVPPVMKELGLAEVEEPIRRTIGCRRSRRAGNERGDGIQSGGYFLALAARSLRRAATADFCLAASRARVVRTFFGSLAKVRRGQREVLVATRR